MIEQLAAAIGLDAMLAPLPRDTSVGDDLRGDFSATSIYYRLRDARAEARAAERAADGAVNADVTVPPEWRSVRQLACSALSDATKDLEIAAWLTEALVRSDGIAGLAVGARLMAGLIGGYWHTGLFPTPDEDGVVTRVAPVTGLNGQGGDGSLIQPLRKQMFFARPDGGPVAFWEFEASQKLQGEADPKKRQQRLAAGVRPFDEMEQEAKAAGRAWFAALRAELRAALGAWVALGDALDTLAGRDSPPTGRVRTLLEEMRDAVARYAPEEVAMIAEAIPVEDEVPATAGGASVSAARQPQTREEMLRELARIADFFRRTEPHSPLAYTLDDAVRRGRMSWPDLLAEIVPDTGARTQMLLQLGIKPNPT